MSALDGFRTFNFKEGVPYVSVTSNGITFNKAVMIKLNYPKHVIFLINENLGQVALQACDENTPNAVEFFKPKREKVISVRWNGKDLLNTVKGMMQWDLEKESYRIEGELIPEERAMIFDLKKATKLN